MAAELPFDGKLRESVYGEQFTIVQATFEDEDVTERVSRHLYESTVKNNPKIKKSTHFGLYATGSILKKACHLDSTVLQLDKHNESTLTPLKGQYAGYKIRVKAHAASWSDSARLRGSLTVTESLSTLHGQNARLVPRIFGGEQNFIVTSPPDGQPVIYKRIASTLGGPLDRIVVINQTVLGSGGYNVISIEGNSSIVVSRVVMGALFEDRSVFSETEQEPTEIVEPSVVVASRPELDGNTLIPAKFRDVITEAIGVKWDDVEIDHVDHNPKNNHPSNLRFLTRKENRSNIKSDHLPITGGWLMQLPRRSKWEELKEWSGLQQPNKDGLSASQLSVTTASSVLGTYMRDDTTGNEGQQNCNVSPQPFKRARYLIEQ